MLISGAIFRANEEEEEEKEEKTVKDEECGVAGILAFPFPRRQRHFGRLSAGVKDADVDSEDHGVQHGVRIMKTRWRRFQKAGRRRTLSIRPSFIDASSKLSFTLQRFVKSRVAKKRKQASSFYERFRLSFDVSRAAKME